MKIDLAYPDPNEETVKQLFDAAQQLGIDARIVNITSSDISSGQITDKLQKNVVWRDGTNIGYSARGAALGYMNYGSARVNLNTGSFLMPQVPSKLFQQQLLKYSTLRQYTLESYKVLSIDELKKLIADGYLSFPMVSKPEYGSGGRGVVYLESIDDVEKLPNITSRVFQNYIENDGEWRIFVIGGTAVGAMKKIRKEERQKFNFIKNGADFFAETDPNEKTKIYDIATKTASLFHLELVGVDIIKNSKTGKYHIIEVNTVAGWTTGFDKATGENIPEIIIKWVQERRKLIDSSTSARYKCVEEYYNNRFNRLSYQESMHWATRMFLWTREDKYKKMALTVKKQYIGIDKSQQEAILSRVKLYKTPSTGSIARNKLMEAKYPDLHALVLVLFRDLIASTVYSDDISDLVENTLNLDRLRQIRSELVRNSDDIFILSSYAINFLYLLTDFLNEDIEKTIDVLKLANESRVYYQELVQTGEMSHKEAVLLNTYFLTHVVICKSRFYAQKITDEKYKEICKITEAIIRENYFDIPLDNKLEFLVAARLCDFDTDLSKIILGEAERSISWAGNFIAEPRTNSNNDISPEISHTLNACEHRSVLYVMVHKPYIHGTT